MWARIVQIAVGIALMAAPDLLDYSAPAATNDRVVGPLIVTFAAIAIGESTRPVRWWNAPLGVWLMAAAWVLSAPMSIAALEFAAGLLTLLLCFVRGPLRERLGGGWRVLAR